MGRSFQSALNAVGNLINRIDVSWVIKLGLSVVTFYLLSIYLDKKYFFDKLSIELISQGVIALLGFLCLLKLGKFLKNFIGTIPNYLWLLLLIISYSACFFLVLDWGLHLKIFSNTPIEARENIIYGLLVCLAISYLGADLKDWIDHIQKTFKRKIESPALAALAIGLFPFLFYISNNITLIFEYIPIFDFAKIFILIPFIIISTAYHFLYKKLPPIISKRIIPGLMVVLLISSLKLTIFELNPILIAVALIAALLFIVFMYKEATSLMLLLFLMSAFSGYNIISEMITIQKKKALKQWMELPDDIEKTKFTKRHNIYLIQPDSYVNISEMSEGYYNIDNQEMYNWLNNSGFKLYENFRSNYGATIHSNLSLFTMRHHHYQTARSLIDAYGGRETLIGENAVLNILRENDYKLALVSSTIFMIARRTSIIYDYCNVKNNSVSPLDDPVKTIVGDVVEDTKEAIETFKDDKRFIFLEHSASPAHIAGFLHQSKGVEKEREEYIERVMEANEWLKEVIAHINEVDTNALIIVAADHGGYVGLEAAEQAYIKTEDPNLVRSYFSSMLAIKWPNDYDGSLDDKFHSVVNLFRNVFSYMSDRPEFANTPELDESFIMLNKGAENGTYKYINDANEVVIERISVNK